MCGWLQTKAVNIHFRTTTNIITITTKTAPPLMMAMSFGVPIVGELVSVSEVVVPLPVPTVDVEVVVVDVDVDVDVVVVGVEVEVDELDVPIVAGDEVE